nr:MAG TPA: DNA cytosine methyltransferase [Caudoviricetes sp.]
MLTPQFVLPLHNEIVVDNFAGGGGASTGIERAIGHPVDEALNHDPKALSMHRMNHPQTRHHCEDIRMADPLKIAAGRPVGLAWFSPDCKHFSKAKGGKPRDKKIRGLAWVVVHWVNKVAPRVIVLENVEEFQTWGPLNPDGTPKREFSGLFFRAFVGALRRRGYEVEWKELRACDYGAPTIRRRFFLVARRDGQPISWPEPTHGPGRYKKYRAVAECIDFSLPCPSIFLSREEARAAHVKRPLADATQQRIARGVEKFVLKDARPFIVCLTHHGGDRIEDLSEPAKTITGAHNGEKAIVTVKLGCLTRYNVGATGGTLNAPINTICGRSKLGGKDGGNGFGLVECKAAFVSYGQHGGNSKSAADPSHTICANNKDTNQVVECRLVHIAKFRGTNIGHAAAEPLHTITGGGTHHALTCCYLAQQNGGFNKKPGRKADSPISTLTGTGSQQQIVACALATNTTGHGPTSPKNFAPTLTTGGQQMLLSAYLVPYYGCEKDGQAADAPCRTITSKDRFALAQPVLAVEPLTPEKIEKARGVADWLRSCGVDVQGEFALAGPFVIWDIGLRMLTPRECYLAQGFPPSYIIDCGLSMDNPHRVIPLNKSEQMRMCGNSVCPQMATAIVNANYTNSQEIGKGAAV